MNHWIEQKGELLSLYHQISAYYSSHHLYPIILPHCLSIRLDFTHFRFMHTLLLVVLSTVPHPNHSNHLRI